jgi:hypothetical protein
MASGLGFYSLLPSKADENRHYSQGIFCNLSGTLKQRSYSGISLGLQKYRCEVSSEAAKAWEPQ